MNPSPKRVATQHPKATRFERGLGRTRMKPSIQRVMDRYTQSKTAARSKERQELQDAYSQYLKSLREAESSALIMAILLEDENLNGKIPRDRVKDLISLRAVSYTHLTLPTKA